MIYPFSPQLERLRLGVYQNTIDDFYKKEGGNLLHQPGDRLENITDIKRLNGKGLGIVVQNRAEPIRLYPRWDSVYLSTIVKKEIALFLREFDKANPIKKIMMMIGAFSLKNIYLDFAETSFRDKFLPEDKFSQPVQEIHRCLNLYFPNNIKVFISFILEYDMAYRYRIQDVLSELNKYELMRNPRKEIMRLMGILVRREKTSPGMGQKWRVMKWIMGIYLFFDRGLVKRTKSFLYKLNINEIRASREDRYWMATYTEYDFNDKTFEQRMLYIEQNYGIKERLYHEKITKNL